MNLDLRVIVPVRIGSWVELFSLITTGCPATEASQGGFQLSPFKMAESKVMVGRLTSAARMILPHFLTTGSNALKSDNRSKTKAMLKMNSFLS